MQSPAASESNYYVRFGLTSDPFAADAMPEFFFVGAQRRFLAQRAVHALYFSGATVLLIGADGTGKTRTLAEIAKDLKGLADICRIEASVLMNAAEIRALLASALGLPGAAAAGNTEFVYALERIRPADGDPQPVLIAIDAAQLLSIETLAECAALVAGAGGRLRLLLAGEADLHTAWQQAQAGAAEILELKPLDRNEAEDYVRTKIQAAGYREEHLLDDAAFNRLYEQSGGNFAIINALMPQFLQPQSEPASITQRVRQLPLVHVVVATIALAVIILLVLYRSGDSESSQQIQLAQPKEITQPISDEKKKGVATVALKLPASSPASNTAQETTSQSSSSASTSASAIANTSPVSKSTASEPITKPLPVVTDAVEKKAPEQQMSQKPIVEKIIPEKPAAEKQSTDKQVTEKTVAQEKPIAVKKEMPPKAEAEQPASTKSSSLNDDEEALLAMSSSNYVLQLLGAESKTTVDKFAKGAGKGLKLYVYHTKLRGKPWIIVVTGPYADKNAATVGVEKLPEAVRKQQPWPRTLANVQADIRAHNSR